MYILKIAEVLGEIFIIIALGFFTVKKNIVDERHFTMIADLIILITTPALIFYSMYSTYSPDLLKTNYIVPFVGVLVPLFTFVISVVVLKIFRVPADRRSIFYIISMFSNTTFLGIPVNMALFGQKSILTVILYDLGHTTLFWTFGVWLLTNNRVSIKNFKNLINPPVISLFITIAIVLSGINIPSFIVKAAQMVGNITVPFAMMFIGMNIACIKAKDEKIGGSITAVALVKLIISPIVAILITAIIHLPVEVKRVVIMEAALPTMLSSAIVAKQYSKNYSIASISVLVTTIVCFFSLPLILYMISFH